MIDNYIKVLFIALCFIIALCSYWFCHSKRDWAYLTGAMGLTLVSDYFLVLTNNHSTGVFVFCFVHILYILRVSDNREKSAAQIATTIFIGAVVFAAFVFVPMLPFLHPIIVLTLVYTALFIQDIIAHIKYYKSKKEEALPIVNRRIMLAGLILFALCDIHVLMFNLPHYLPVSPAIGMWGRMWIWVFYAPSQLLLSISAVVRPSKDNANIFEN